MKKSERWVENVLLCLYIIRHNSFLKEEIWKRKEQWN